MTPEAAKNFELIRSSFDRRFLSFADVVAISGIDLRQLRNGLDRDVIRVGEKHRNGRWSFSLRDALKLLATHKLSTLTLLPIGLASAAADQVAEFAESIIDQMLTLAAQPSDQATDTQFVIYAAAGDIRVLRHLRGENWGFYTSAGERLESGSWQDAHIRLPSIGLMTDLIQGWSALSSHAADPE